MADVAVKIGAGQCQDDGAAGKCFRKASHRLVTAPGVQGQHQIGRCAIPFHLDVDAVAELAQETCPAAGGIAVAGAGAAGAGGDKDNFHLG